MSCESGVADLPPTPPPKFTARMAACAADAAPRMLRVRVGGSSIAAVAEGVGPDDSSAAESSLSSSSESTSTSPAPPPMPPRPDRRPPRPPRRVRGMPVVSNDSTAPGMTECTIKDRTVRGRSLRSGRAGPPRRFSWRFWARCSRIMEVSVRSSSASLIS